MSPNRLWLFAGVMLWASVPASGKGLEPDPKARALAAKIDEHIAAGWAAAMVAPAPLADDAEFLRRVYLDLAGRIPKVSEVRQFLDDRRPDKRQRVVEELLQSPRYVVHFANYWRSLLLPEVNANFQVRFAAQQFEPWLRKHLKENSGYDTIARELLTAPIAGGRGRGAIMAQGGEANPAGFYFAKEFKPENLAASTARLFLGVRVECAQCHNHPFADWKRDQFWSFAAFFAGLESRRQGDLTAPAGENLDKREIAVGGTDRLVKATFLDGKEPQFQPNVSSRVTLADWVTAPDNPFFARAAVNRLWAYFLGAGLIEPVDEMVGAESTPSHPGLLDELAREFAANKFDLKVLIRAITYSRPYQLTSGVASQAPRRAPGDLEPVANPPDLDSAPSSVFARMPLRGLTPEQLWDSLSEATGYQEQGANDPYGVVRAGGSSPRDEFLSRFANQTERAVDSQTSILQALALMNGKVIANETSVERSNILAGLLDAPFFDKASRIETLYLATLSRKPTAREIERITRYMNEAKKPDTALADVLWALLNSSEFILNH